MTVRMQSRAHHCPVSPAFTPMRSGKLQRKCACGGTPGHTGECEECRKKAEGQLQRRTATNATPTEVPPIVYEVLRSPGQPLDADTRAFMEPRFGEDFSEVLVHADARSAESARAVDALAYTVGHRVVFGAGQYQPATKTGQRLLAHELAHVVQQTSFGPASLHAGLASDQPNTASEQEANVAADRLMQGESTVVTHETAHGVQRSPAGVGFGILGGAATGALIGGLAAGPLGALAGAAIGAVAGGIIGSVATRGGRAPACTGTARTLSIDAVRLRGATRDPRADVAFANAVFDPCCVRVTLARNETATPALSDTWLGGDTDLATGTCGAASPDELNAYSGATAQYGLTSPIRAFYAATISSGARGESYPPYCATGTAAAIRGMLKVTNSGADRTLSHELGHVLLNSGDHPPEMDNLMHPTNTATGEQLTAAQCAAANANV
jgi:hypothetical protein